MIATGRLRSTLRHILRALTLALAFATAMPAVGSAQTPESLTAADRLIAAQDIDAMMVDMATQIAGKLPEHMRQSYVNAMTDPGFLTRMKTTMRMAMAKHLDAKELNALADFYSTPIAKSAMSKMGAYMAEAMPFLQNEMIGVAQRMMQEGGGGPPRK